MSIYDELCHYDTMYVKGVLLVLYLQALKQSTGKGFEKISKYLSQI